MAAATVDGYPHQVWWNADGETIVESYTITDMAHGTPLGIADNDERYGAEGAFLIEAGISSSYHIANFFGLTEWIREPASDAAAKSIPGKSVAGSLPTTIPMTPPAPARSPDLTAMLWPLATLTRPPEPPRPRTPPHDRRRRCHHARAHRRGTDEIRAAAALEHDPEKWEPVFRKDRAQTKKWPRPRAVPW